MKSVLPVGLMPSLLLPSPAGAQAPAGLGAEEFGLTQRQLVQAIEQGEALFAQCMREQGIEHVAVDYNTLRAGMKSDKSMPGMGEEDVISKYRFGVATMYTGQPPQLSTGYSPERVGLGEQNIQIFKSLSPADQVAYNRALPGENADATFAVALETENLSLTSGYTRKAVEQVFNPDQLKTNYYNPQNALINNDLRMKAALCKFAAEMKKSGFDFNHPNDIRTRLAALTNNGAIPIEKMTADQRAELRKLQDCERRVGARMFKLQEDLLVPFEDPI